MTKRLVSLNKIIINVKWNKKNKYLNFFLNLISSNLLSSSGIFINIIFVVVVVVAVFFFK